MRLLPSIVIAVILAGCVDTARDGGDPLVVSAQAAAFEPSERTVDVGDTLTFVMDVGSHTVDFSEDEEAVDGVDPAHSGNLDPGDRHEVTFSEPGTYPYFCRYHSSISGGQRVGMVGTITVG